MKRILLILIMVMTLVGCSNNNVSFEATIESINENSIMVYTSDDVGFDKARVSLKDAKINGQLQVGQKVLLTIHPEIRESYPVQVTAVHVEVIKPSVKKISAAEAKTMIDSQNYDVILDVRNLDEYNQGHIANATLLPVDQISNSAQDLLKNKDDIILVYCRSGNRSKKAAQSLIDMGYTNVYDFGGISDWPYDIVK